MTENTSWDGNNYDFYFGETGNRVFLLLQQFYSHSFSLWSCAAGVNQGATPSQQLAEFPFTAVSSLAGQATRMEFAGNQVRLLVGATPLVSATTDANGWVTYTGTNGSGRVTAPLGAPRFWLTLAGGEKPGFRELVISDKPQTITRFTFDGSDVTETSIAITSPLTLTHDATIRARVYSAAAYRSPETVAVFTSTIPLLPAESFVSPAYMEILHATLDGSPALVSLSGPSGTTNGFAINNHRFILRYPLQVNEPTPVTLSRTTLPDLSTNIVWREMDLAASSLPDPMAIRAGDSLLFTAGVGATGTLHIAVMDGSNQVCQTREGVTGEKLPVRFDQGGTFTVIASVDGISVGSLIVHVVYVDFDGPVACQVGYKREKGVAVYGPTNQVFFTAKNPALLEVSVKEVTSYGVRLYLKALGRGTPVVQARLGSATGPLLAEQEVEEFTADSSAAQHLVVNGDTDTANTILTMKPWIPNVDVNFGMYAHYSTFAGGATAYTLNTSDQTSVDINGAPAIDLLVDPTTGETQAVIRVDIEIPADEDSYCFSASFDQHSKYGTVVGDVRCNGKPCKFTIEEIFIREGDLSGHTLTNTADNVNTNNHPSGHSHTITPVESTKFSVTARPTFNCKTDSSFPHWDPTVALTANAMASNKLSVTICNTTFSNVVIVLKVDIDPVQTNVCSATNNAVLNLTTNSYWAPEYSGAMTWSSTPTGLSGSGSGGTFTFNPNASTPTSYVVTARSTLLTNCYDTCTVNVYRVELTPDATNVCWLSSNPVEIVLTNSYAPGGITWSGTNGLKVVSATDVKLVFTPTNSVATNYAVKAASTGSPNCYDVCTVNVLKVELLKLGGSKTMTEPACFRVYVPSKWGGKLTVSTTDGTISDLKYPDGSAYGNGDETGENKNGWYTFKVLHSSGYTVSSTFLEVGDAGVGWTCYWWPMLTGTGTHLYDIGGPLDKYDTWHIAKYGGGNPGVRAWEFANHRTTNTVDDWHGHCNQKVAVVIHQTEPIASTEEGIAFSELDKEGLLVAIWEEYKKDDFANIGDDDPAAIHDKWAKYIKSQNKKLGIDTWHDEYEGSVKVWNYVMYGYTSTMIADGTDDVGRLKLHVSTKPKVQDGPEYTYEYFLIYDATTGDISSGTWKFPETGPTKQRRPDITWRPTSRETAPSPINPTKALDIVY